MADKPIDPEQYKKAIAIVAEAGQASISMLQRTMKIGYTTAARLIEQMETENLIGPFEGNKPRAVHITVDQLESKPTRKKKATAKTTTRKKAPAKVKTPPKKQTQEKDAQEPEKPKRKGGRPKLWDELNIPDKLDSVRGWTMQGATMVELAEMLGVSETTVYEWQATYPEFAEAVRAGRNISNGELLNAAFKTSTGFTVTKKVPVKYKVFEKFKVTDPKTGQTGDVLKQVEKIELVEVVDYVPPNANLLQFMLTNRLPDSYKKKEHIEHGGNIGNSYAYMSDEELEAELAALEGGGENSKEDST